MKTKEIYLAGGCFWGTEHFFKQIEGVIETEVGFANGNTENPTYKEVYTDQTGYAETVMVKYNPEVASLKFLLLGTFVPTNSAAYPPTPATIGLSKAPYSNTFDGKTFLKAFKSFR